MIVFQVSPEQAGNDILIRLATSVDEMVQRMFLTAARRDATAIAADYRKAQASSSLSFTFPINARVRELDGVVTSLAATALERALLLVWAYATDKMPVRKRNNRGHRLSLRFNHIVKACPKLEGRFDRLFTNALNPGLIDIVCDGVVEQTLANDIEGIPFHHSEHGGLYHTMEVTTFDPKDASHIRWFVRNRKDDPSLPTPGTFNELLQAADESYTDHRQDGVRRRVPMRNHEYSALDTQMNTSYMVAGIRFFGRLICSILTMAVSEQWFWNEELRTRWWERRQQGMDTRIKALAKEDLGIDLSDRPVLSMNEIVDEFGFEKTEDHREVKRLTLHHNSLKSNEE